MGPLEEVNGETMERQRWHNVDNRAEENTGQSNTALISLTHYGRNLKNTWILNTLQIVYDLFT